MDKTKIRIILILVTALVSSLSLFGVLYAEESKRRVQMESDRKEMLARAEEADAARRAYYESIRQQKEELRKQMEKSQTEYEDLLAKQPDLVAGQKKTVSKVVEEVVPVTTTQTVAKPKSTSKTKAS